MRNSEEIREEIDMCLEYLAILTTHLALAESIEAGRQASAELLTEKLIERIKHD